MYFYTYFFTCNFNYNFICYFSTNNEPASENVPQLNDTATERDVESTSNTPNKYNSPITNHLRGHLTALRNLRHGFIEQHGSEPSVSLRYSQQSTSNSTISLRVGDEVERSNYVEGNAQAVQASSGQERNQDEVSCVTFLKWFWFVKLIFQ